MIRFSQNISKEASLPSDTLLTSRLRSGMHQRGSRNSRKKLEVLRDKILRKVHLDQSFRVDLRLTKPHIYYDVGNLLKRLSVRIYDRWQRSNGSIFGCVREAELMI